jgi:hypothetical protein
MPMVVAAAMAAVAATEDGEAAKDVVMTTEEGTQRREINHGL